MANISLQGSIRTCKVDTAWANKLQSDRFFNPEQMLCPPWNGVDTAGRSVCADSFYTKTPGCNSSSDRVTVENALRPQYIEYVTLDAEGIRGDLDCGVGATDPDAICHRQTLNNVHKYTGQFGYKTGFSQNIYPNCVTCKNHPDQSAYGSQNMRTNQFLRESYRTQQNRCRSGM